MFRYCTSPEEVKKLFRKLSLKLHPDMGGDADLFSLLQKCYEETLTKNKFYEKIFHKKDDRDYSSTLEDIYADDRRLNIIVDIFKYAESHKKFDDSFVSSVNEYLEENGFITSSQYNTLVKCYYAFRMDKK